MDFINWLSAIAMDLLSKWGIYAPLILYGFAIIIMFVEAIRTDNNGLLLNMLFLAPGGNSFISDVHSIMEVMGQVFNGGTLVF